jgi:hypothetical protein
LRDFNAQQLFRVKAKFEAIQSHRSTLPCKYHHLPLSRAQIFYQPRVGRHLLGLDAERINQTFPQGIPNLIFVPGALCRFSKPFVIHLFPLYTRGVMLDDPPRKGFNGIAYGVEFLDLDRLSSILDSADHAEANRK